MFSREFCTIFKNTFFTEHLRATAFVHRIFSCITAWKVFKCWVFSGRYFPVFRLNTVIYFVNLRIESEYWKIRTRKNFVFGHFSHSDIFDDDSAIQLWLSTELNEKVIQKRQKKKLRMTQICKMPLNVFQAI